MLKFCCNDFWNDVGDWLLEPVGLVTLFCADGWFLGWFNVSYREIIFCTWIELSSVFIGSGFST